VDRPTAPVPATPPLFSAGRLAARALVPREVPLLQALFDANPLYFQAVNGRAPHADEAQQEFDELPPPHLPFTQRWFLGLFERGDDADAGHAPRGGALQGVAVALQDFCAPGVWHLSLYLLATALHGSGVAAGTYHAWEAWMANRGARWLRLGVVAGNTRAERFWQAQGYTEVRRRDGIDTGGRINSVRVLAKPLADGRLDDQAADRVADHIAGYLALVPRDHPDSTLP